MVDIIINRAPKQVRVLKGSLNTKIPIIILVMGSNVLSTEDFCPPIKKVPFWKRMTAPTQSINEKHAQASQQSGFAGKVSC